MGSYQERDLQAQIDELKAELRALGQPSREVPSSRRLLLKNLGLAAAGAVAGSVAGGAPAGAATGDALALGEENTADANTIVRGSATDTVFTVLEDGSPVPSSLGVFQAMADGAHRWGIGGLVRSTPDGAGPDELPFGVVGLVQFGVPGIGIGGNGTYGGAFQGTRAQLVLVPWEERDDGAAHHVGEYFQDPSSLWACVADGEPGVWQKVAGTTAAGQLHVLSPPTRIYDSRPGEAPLDVTKGLLENSAQRVIDATYGGVVPASVNGATPTAALVNLTITDSSSSGGYLALFESGTTWPGNSTINWDAVGAAAANTTVVPLDDQGRFTVRASPGGGAHFVIDVLGYWL
jgi:hypothetical protein